MRINPVTVTMSAYVAKRVLKIVEKAHGKTPNDLALCTALDELNAALANRD